MKTVSKILQLCCLCGAVCAFSGTALQRQLGVQNRQLSRKLMTKEDNEHSLQNAIGAFGVAASIFAFSCVGAPAQAASPSIPASHIDHVIFSSSMQVSETIKTMDFSLPSSYDTISDAKASATDELVQEENVLTGTKVKKAPKAKASNDVFSIGGPELTPEEKAAQAAQIKAAREEAAAEKKALEAEKQAEREAIAAAKKAEREALDAERAEQRAIADAERASKAQAAKEARAKAESAKASKAADAKFAGADFVDMGLPSYGDSTSTKARSAFSI